MYLNKISVLGAGVWGSVIAQHFAALGFNVCVWEYSKELLAQINEGEGKHPNIPNFKFNPSITFTNNIEENIKDTDMIVFVISSKAVRSFCKQLKPLLNGRVLPVLSASKGLEDDTFKTMCEIIEEEIPHLESNVFAFSGPSFALEVARGIPTKIMLAGHNGLMLGELKRLLSKPPLLLETSYDRRGAEYGGAIKNVVAIGCGILHGIGDGANTLAALLTKAMQEMNTIMVYQGCNTETVYGLCGLGDAILTGMSSISRNRRLGEKLGRGLTLEEAKKEVGTIAEGANSVQSIYDLIQKKNLNCPVITAIWRIVIKGEKPRALIEALGFQEAR
ncbi:MAG: NAD(P)-dependent glycerol-3-phosphate dehydrogenase [Elusimicrobiota bacterium]|jgi:glycerol-3-phosphate dehydrogenase (NAD(P)+)|nr:NAD(P)-dependent glycerol-3-phosphate dehydrogenase [Elusimicrobiota bacterium]